MQLRALSFTLLLIFAFPRSGMQSSLGVLWLWWVYDMICLHLKQFINLMSTNHSYFRFPSPPVSIRLLKLVLPSGTRSYTFPTLPSSPRRSALNLEATLLCGPQSQTLPCVGTFRTQPTMKPVAQCESAGGRA